MDVPIYTQYGHWMGSIILYGDLGKSLWRDRPVIEEIILRLPVTFELGLSALSRSGLNPPFASQLYAHLLGPWR